MNTDLRTSFAIGDPAAKTKSCYLKRRKQRFQVIHKRAGTKPKEDCIERNSTDSDIRCVKYTTWRFAFTTTYWPLVLMNTYSLETLKLPLRPIEFSVLCPLLNNVFALQIYFPFQHKKWKSQRSRLERNTKNLWQDLILDRHITIT